MWTSKQGVQDGLIKENIIFVNTLSPEIFRGSEVKYGKVGHIPGSINIYYKLFTTKAPKGFYLKASAEISESIYSGKRR